MRPVLGFLDTDPHWEEYHQARKLPLEMHERAMGWPGLTPALGRVTTTARAVWRRRFGHDGVSVAMVKTCP